MLLMVNVMLTDNKTTMWYFYYLQSVLLSAKTWIICDFVCKRFGTNWIMSWTGNLVKRHLQVGLSGHQTKGMKVPSVNIMPWKII